VGSSRWNHFSTELHNSPTGILDADPVSLFPLLPEEEKQEMTRKIYTTEELALRFRCTPRCITDWIRKGCPVEEGRVKLPARKLGRRWFATEEDVLLFEHRSRPSDDGRPDLELDEE
tara:strand:+ start:19883 stop:20233 length:351 start_codon:yes stop_codon:yes gene_type:complete